DYADLLPKMPPDQWRRIRGEQEIIVRHEPERALETLPQLLSKAEDREKLLTLVRKLLLDERMNRAQPTTEQIAMVENIGETLHAANAGHGWASEKAARQRSRKPPRAKGAKGTS